MFPTEPEQQAESKAERDRRRARTGVDRRGLKQVAIALTLIFGGLALLIAADIARLERRLTTATVVGLFDRSGLRRTMGCTTQLATGFGYAKIFSPTECRYVSWHIGDQAEVEARQLRFTRTIVVSTRGTLFDGARSILPES